jgi:transposase
MTIAAKCSPGATRIEQLPLMLWTAPFAMPRRSSVRAVTTIGIDMGKNTLHMVGLDSLGAIVLRERVSRGRITSRLSNLPPCLIGIEAGMATHYVARELAALGHDVKQVPPAYAKPFRQGHKNDFRDAHAVAEAVQRPTMKFVATKTADQLDLQALHRVWERLVSQRTGIINQIRALLLVRFTCRGLREDETRWRFGLPAHANTGDPNGLLRPTTAR